jgi:pimeloyl-ACP methyl ester carboxylesterase
MEWIEGKAKRDIIFIHGAGLNANEWKDVMSILSGEKKAYALNLPGHPKGKIVCKTVEEYADQIIGFIQQNESRFVLCGHSMGGAIALRVAIKRPDLVSALILVSTSAKFYVDRRIVEGFEENTLRTIEHVITPLSFYTIDENIIKKARDALSLENSEVFLNDYLACSSFDETNNLKYVQPKTLIICGEQDRMTKPYLSQYLHQNIPDSELYLIRNAGHMLPIEKPNILANLISSFLEKI